MDILPPEDSDSLDNSKPFRDCASELTHPVIVSGKLPDFIREIDSDFARRIMEAVMAAQTKTAHDRAHGPAG